MSAPLHPMPLGAITLRDVAALLTKIDKASGAPTANRVRSSLSACFSWAMREGLAPSNPIANTNRREEQTRDRVLSNDELRRIWNAAGEDAYGTIGARLVNFAGVRSAPTPSPSPASAPRTSGRMLFRWHQLRARFLMAQSPTDHLVFQITSWSLHRAPSTNAPA